MDCEFAGRLQVSGGEIQFILRFGCALLVGLGRCGKTHSQNVQDCFDSPAIVVILHLDMRRRNNVMSELAELGIWKALPMQDAEVQGQRWAS